MEAKGLGERFLAAVVIAALVTATVAVGRPALASDAEPSGGVAAVLEDGSSLLNSYSVIGGVFTEFGNGELSGWKSGQTLRPTARGVRYYDRNGFVSGTIAAIAIMLAGAAAASGPKKTESWDSGGYRYTRYTYYSPAEKAAMAAATSAAASGIFGAKHQSFDLQIYSRNLGGNSDGWRMIMLFGVPFADGNGQFDLGFGYAHVRSAIGDAGKFLLTEYQYVGMPFRLSYSLGAATIFSHFDWNWYGHSKDLQYNNKTAIGTDTTSIMTTGFPWRFGAQAAVLGRVYLEGALTTPSLFSGSFGVTSSVGARF